MATKKAKKKGAKAKAKTGKRSAPGRAKKTSAPRRKQGALRKPAKRKTPAASAGTRKKVTKVKGPKLSRKPTKSAAKPFRREDRPGHLDPRYKAGLREQSGGHGDAVHAFIDRPRSPNDDLAEELGESVIEKATSGEDDGEDNLDQIVPEEQGGPFVETKAAQEFAHGTDASNPKGAKREPFPTT
jgi:hypothetical protein